MSTLPSEISHRRRWPWFAGGILLLLRLGMNVSYWTDLLPALLVFGVGLSMTVAPLTATVLADADDSAAGIASAINNSVARLAGLFAVAVLPALAGIEAGPSLGESIDAGYQMALRIAAAVCAVGGVTSFVFVRTAKPTERTTQPGPFAACHHPAVGIDHRRDRCATTPTTTGS